MKIFSRKIEPIFRPAVTETTITIVLDETVTRQCLKYELHPVEFMMEALTEELHQRAILADMQYQHCPHCGGKHK